MLNKIRSLSSEERNSSLPFHGPGLSESESVIIPAEGIGRWKGASLDRETKEWRDGHESEVALVPNDRLCEEISFWKP